MDKPINEKFVSFSGRAIFPKTLNYGDDVKVTIDGNNYIFNCIEIKGQDNQDGSINVIYKLKSLT